MGKYFLSEATVEAKMAAEKERQKYENERLELRKRRELMRRQIAAALYEPRLCMGDPVTGEACPRYAIPGAGFCAEHGGTTKMMQTAAKTRLLYLVEPALRVINKCMNSGDLNVALKAAQIILDRAGFHPHATLEITEQPTDYSVMSARQLAARAEQLVSTINASSSPDNEEQRQLQQISDEQNGLIIDVVEKNETERKVH